MNSALQKALARLNVAELRHHPLVHDSISVTALIASAAINIITLLLLIVKGHRVNYPVPVHYTNLVGFDQVGAWYETYRIAAFGIFVTIVNTALAAKSFQRNRLVSFFLLIGSVAIAVLCLVIGLEFAVIV